MSASDVRCKGVHVKLDKETHANFKARLIQHNVSMQEAFEEFAKQIGQESASANRLIENLVKARIREELATVGVTPMKLRKKPRYVSELDNESLYDLINEEELETIASSRRHE